MTIWGIFPPCGDSVIPATLILWHLHLHIYFPNHAEKRKRKWKVSHRQWNAQSWNMSLHLTIRWLEWVTWPLTRAKGSGVMESFNMLRRRREPIIVFREQTTQMFGLRWLCYSCCFSWREIMPSSILGFEPRILSHLAKWLHYLSHSISDYFVTISKI